MKEFLLFKLGSHSYSLEIEKVQEIVENPALYFIPSAPPCYCGAMNFHGEILPVLDLGVYLGCGDIVSSPRVLVLTPRIAALALKVETARRIISINPEELQPAAENNFEFQESTFDLQGELISVLDLPGLLHHLQGASATTAQLNFSKD